MYSIKDVIHTTMNVKQNALQSLATFMSSSAPLNVTEIKILNKCVQQCPESYNGKKVAVNDAVRKCVVLETDAEMVMETPSLNEAGSLYDAIIKLKAQYDKSIKSVDVSIPNKRKAGKSERCSFRGLFMKRERGDYDSYFFCRCDVGYTGDNCQIPVSLASHYQSLLVQALDTLDRQFLTYNQHTRKVFLETLYIMNRFKVNLPIIQKMASIIQVHLKQDKMIENRKKLYGLFDALLLNLFDLIDDQKRLPLELYESMREVKVEADTIYETVNVIIKEIEIAFEDLNYSHSFLEHDMNHFISQDKYSYVMAEFRLRDLNLDKGFYISNPNIDMSTYTHFAGNWIRLSLPDSEEIKTNKFNLQALNFSSSLFENKMNSLNITFLSNLLYLRFIDPKRLRVDHDAVDAGVSSMTFKLTMLFIPAYDEPEKYLACRAYNFDRNDFITGTLDRFIEAYDDQSENGKNKNAYALCTFRTVFKFRSYFFILVLRKDI